MMLTNKRRKIITTIITFIVIFLFFGIAFIVSNINRDGDFNPVDARKSLFYAKQVIATNDEKANDDFGANINSDKDFDSSQDDSLDSTPQSDSTTGLSLVHEVMNSWEDNGETFKQIDFTILNNGSTSVDGWSVEIHFTNNINVINSWNSNITISGKTITVKPEEYNTEIGSKRAVTFGIIISAQDDFNIENYGF